MAFILRAKSLLSILLAIWGFRRVAFYSLISVLLHSLYYMADLILHLMMEACAMEEVDVVTFLFQNSKQWWVVSIAETENWLDGSCLMLIAVILLKLFWDQSQSFL